MTLIKTNLDGLINGLKKMSSIQQIMDRIMSRLCEIGAEAIRIAYSDGMTGSSAASVRVEHSDNKWYIVAESEGILYIEFGAGVAKNSDEGGGSRDSLSLIDTNGTTIYEIGSYGKGQGSNSNGWWYNDGSWKHTLGTRARHGFADAITAIIAQAQLVISEEFKK